MIIKDVTAVTMKPLYNAPIILYFSLVLQPSSNNRCNYTSLRWLKDKSLNYNLEEKIDAKTIVATIVTA